MCPFGWKSVHPLRLVVIFDNGEHLVSFCFLILGPSVIDDVVFLLPEPYGMEHNTGHGGDEDDASGCCCCNL